MNPIYILSDKQIDGVHNLPIIQTQTVQSDLDLNGYDALIFTSKNGVISTNQLNPSWKQIPSYAIANATAKVIEKYEGNVVFTGNSGHGNELAKELIPYLKNKKALYLKGAKTVSNLVEILQENGIDCDAITVYETSCKSYEKNQQPQKNGVIIFSSPSTIECFFNSFTWDESYKAICIGHTTAQYLPKDIKAYIPHTTSLEACIALAKTLSPSI